MVEHSAVSTKPPTHTLIGSVNTSAFLGANPIRPELAWWYHVEISKGY
jgi:hypothetical protein